MPKETEESRRQNREVYVEEKLRNGSGENGWIMDKKR